jgi:hypothetical protein
VIAGWRKLHIEERHNLYASPRIIRTIEPRMMRWAGHVARMREKKECIQSFGLKARGKDTTRKTKT